MTTEKMTIHKALCELKIIDNRIKDEITASKFVIANKHSNEKINGASIDSFREKSKASYQRVTDLINRRNAIKRAVVLSNAVTKVTIGDTEYTIAEAIDMKNNGISIYTMLLGNLYRQYNQALSFIEDNSGETLARKAENYVLSVIAAQPKDSKMSIDSEAMKALSKNYIIDNTYDLIDPINSSKILDDLRNKIDTFRADIDSALSVSNALTIIEINY